MSKIKEYFAQEGRYAADVVVRTTNASTIGVQPSVTSANQLSQEANRGARGPMIRRGARPAGQPSNRSITSGTGTVAGEKFTGKVSAKVATKYARDAVALLAKANDASAAHAKVLKIHDQMEGAEGLAPELIDQFNTVFAASCAAMNAILAQVSALMTKVKAEQTATDDTNPDGRHDVDTAGNPIDPDRESNSGAAHVPVKAQDAGGFASDAAYRKAYNLPPAVANGMDEIRAAILPNSTEDALRTLRRAGLTVKLAQFD